MKRYKIIDNRPKVSDETIDKAMDFDGLISKHGASVPRSSFGLLKSLAITGIVLLLGYLSVVYFFIKENEIAPDSTPTVAEKVQPQKVDEEKVISEEGQLIEQETTSEEIIDEGSNYEKTGKVDNKPINQNTPATDLQDNEVEAAQYVYLEAEPLEGITSLYEYFDSTLKYPVESLKDSIQGVTLVTFTINTEGRAEKIIIEKSLGPLFDQEATRVIEGMQEWRPASINGQNIASKVSIPLTFRIEN